MWKCCFAWGVRQWEVRAGCHVLVCDVTHFEKIPIWCFHEVGCYKCNKSEVWEKKKLIFICKAQRTFSWKNSDKNEQREGRISLPWQTRTGYSTDLPRMWLEVSSWSAHAPQWGPGLCLDNTSRQGSQNSGWTLDRGRFIEKKNKETLWKGIVLNYISNNYVNITSYWIFLSENVAVPSCDQKGQLRSSTGRLWFLYK